MKVYGNFKQEELSGDFGIENSNNSYDELIYNKKILAVEKELATYRATWPWGGWERPFEAQWADYIGGRLKYVSKYCVGWLDGYYEIFAKLNEIKIERQKSLLEERASFATIEETKHLEELQMTIDHLNSQLRANKNMNISLSEQNTQMVKQVNTYKDRVGQLEKQNSILTSERNTFKSERDSLKTVIESQLGPQEQKTSIAKKLLVIGGLATAGYVGYQMMGE